jgi:ubiquinol-cytochrome c reductase cytochrome b subunit
MLLYAVPWIDRRFISREAAPHHLLDRPRDNPLRTALGAAGFSAVAVVFAAGSADRLFFQFGFGYEGAIWFFRGAFLAVPVVVFVLTKLICLELRSTGRHPLRGWSGRVLARNRRGGFQTIDR